MPSRSLFSTPCLHAWHEAASDVLHLDWQGRVTLGAVQAASAQVAQLALARRYAHILICTRQVQAVGPEVAAWLAPRLRPGLSLLGAHCLAWVCPMAREGAALKALVQRLATELPLLSRLFIDAAAALAWLRSCPSEQGTYPQPVVDATRLRRIVGVWQWRILAALARNPGWLLASEPGGQQLACGSLPKAIE